MDNKEAAIEWFSMLKEKFVKTEYEGYLDMAIVALEQQNRVITVTDLEGGVLASISGKDIIEADGVHVIVSEDEA